MEGRRVEEIWLIEGILSFPFKTSTFWSMESKDHHGAIWQLDAETSLSQGAWGDRVVEQGEGGCGCKAGRVRGCEKEFDVAIKRVDKEERSMYGG